MTITSYKKKDGRTYYMFHAYIGVDEKTGKEKRVCRRGFESKKAAQIAYLELTQSDIEKEKERSKMTYRDVYELWLKEHKTQVKESSLKADLSKFELHILPAIGDYIISRITHDDMQKFINILASEVKTITKFKTATGYVFRYAMIHGIIDKNPLALVKVPKKQEIEEFENYLDFEELDLFLKTADEILSEKWSMFLHLLAFTGLRRGEALALEWSDIDFKLGTIRVNKNLSKAFEKAVISSAKTKASNRTITLGQTILDRLNAYKSICESDTLVFPNSKREHITLSQPQRKTELVCRKAGIKHITPHGLRHTHCCLLFEAGASIAQVQQRLGHSDSKITLEVYNHVTKHKVKEASNLFENAFNEKRNQNRNQFQFR